MNTNRATAIYHNGETGEIINKPKVEEKAEVCMICKENTTPDGVILNDNNEEEFYCSKCRDEILTCAHCSLPFLIYKQGYWKYHNIDKETKFYCGNC